MATLCWYTEHRAPVRPTFAAAFTQYCSAHLLSSEHDADAGGAVAKSVHSDYARRTGTCTTLTLLRRAGAKRSSGTTTGRACRRQTAHGSILRSVCIKANLTSVRHEPRLCSSAAVAAVRPTRSRGAAPRGSRTSFSTAMAFWWTLKGPRARPCDGQCSKSRVRSLLSSCTFASGCALLHLMRMRLCLRFRDVADIVCYRK